MINIDVVDARRSTYQVLLFSFSSGVEVFRISFCFCEIDSKNRDRLTAPVGSHWHAKIWIISDAAIASMLVLLHKLMIHLTGWLKEMVRRVFSTLKYGNWNVGYVFFTVFSVVSLRTRMCILELTSIGFALMGVYNYKLVCTLRKLLYI